MSCQSCRFLWSTSQFPQMILTIDCQPLILVFAFRQLHNLTQAAASECSLSILSQCNAVVGSLDSTRPKLVPSRLLVTAVLVVIVSSCQYWFGNLRFRSLDDSHVSIDETTAIMPWRRIGYSWRYWGWQRWYSRQQTRPHTDVLQKGHHRCGVGCGTDTVRPATLSMVGGVYYRNARERRFDV